MAGFQQAANALTGSIGAVGGRVGVYNELVGKNKEQREQLAKQNEELEKKNNELTKKNKKLSDNSKFIRNLKKSMSIGDELLSRYMSGTTNMMLSNKNRMEQFQQMKNLAERIDSHLRARASRDIMLDVVYGEKSTAGPTRDLAKEEIKREREKLNGGEK